MGVAVDVMSAFTLSGGRVGSACSRSATVPARWGAAIDVPSAYTYFPRYAVGMSRGLLGSVRSAGEELSPVTMPLVANADAMNDPGDTTVGWWSASPRLE